MLLEEERAQPLDPNFDGIKKITERFEKVDPNSAVAEKEISPKQAETKKEIQTELF